MNPRVSRQTPTLLVLIAFIACAPAFGAVVTCGLYETPIACQARADVEAANEKAYREAVVKKAEMNKELASARAQFWATYPDKPGFDAARAKFVDLLDQKDMYYLVTFFSTADIKNLVPGAPMGSVAEFFDRYVGGVQLDNGISQPSLPEFQDWADSFGKHLKERGGLFTFQAATNAFQALAEAETEHQRYILARDWGEFDLANRVPVGYEAPRNYAAMLYFRFGHVPQRAGFDIVAGMVKVLGADAVDRAANQVKAARKEHDGTLVTTFAPPLKTGPGGQRVPDDTVPMPPYVIGLYVGQLKAFEALATRDDDRRYLLDLIAANTFNPGEKNFHLGKWERATKIFDRYVWAFGEQEVLATARQVRLAVKRARDFAVMDPKALGSTRMEPYAAFEDVLARKDPRGYVRSMLAFSKDASSKADVDTAYRDFVAGANEPKVLETAARISANRPELASGLDILIKALNGSISVDKPVVATVDDWQYIAWKGFSPGAQATYITRGLTPRPGNTGPGQVSNRATFKLQSIADDQARLWLSEIAYNYPSYRPTPAHDTELAYASRHAAPKPDPRTPLIENGEETLSIAGKQLATRWQSVSYTNGQCKTATKVWINDQVPGGMVRKLETNECNGRSRSDREQILESFQGARQPGTADIFEQRAANAAAAPPAPSTPNIYERESPRETARRGGASVRPAVATLPDPGFSDPAYPNYYVSDAAVAGYMRQYCRGLYEPSQLTAQQNQILFKSRSIVDQDVHTCVAWFDVKEVRANRKQAMRFCLTNNNFGARGQATRRADYNVCMNQNDILTALCSRELDLRTHLSQPQRRETFSCPAQAPASNGETAVVLQGGSEDMGHAMEIAAPGLPPLLEGPLPKGFLLGGTPLTEH
ncbi:MAG: hypothetical protein WDO56_14475 [Gammaproteobacteria bacterium]